MQLQPNNGARSRSPELKLLEKVEGINKDKTVKCTYATPKQPVNRNLTDKREIKTANNKFGKRAMSPALYERPKIFDPNADR